MRLSTGRLLTALAGLGAIGTLGWQWLPRQRLPRRRQLCPADASHPQWQLVENYCFKCHNATDWAGSVAFDTMSADAVPEDAKVWEAAIKKLKSGLMPPPGKQAARARRRGRHGFLAGKHAGQSPGHTLRRLRAAATPESPRVRQCRA